jgi:hypothetical protein
MFNEVQALVYKRRERSKKLPNLVFEHINMNKVRGFYLQVSRSVLYTNL